MISRYALLATLILLGVLLVLSALVVFVSDVLGDWLRRYRERRRSRD